MVKADLTRDYYADLDLQPGADTAEIKKQFKKLALTYHPDRNPGRESEVTAKFQKIQSAHEVLTDTQERAKYDNNRSRGSTRFGNSYAGSSGVRGNPWSDAGSQYPPPPKAPTARRPTSQQQPSAGAERYKKWEAPKQSAYQAAHEGPGARQKTYEAWESMKTKSQPFGQSSQQTSQGGPSKTAKPPQVPPRGTPQPAQEENYSRAHQPPPKPRPFYDHVQPESRPASPPRRSHSTNAFNRKGFMPNTPGGDEPAGPKGAYFTQRNKPAVAPDLPAREPAQRSQRPIYPDVRDAVPGMGNVPSQEDLNKHFGAPAPEPRISTPYATHGGEKLNPFETSHINRAKSTREPSQRFTADGQIPRTGSDPNLSSPHRSQSSAGRGPSKSKHQTTPSVEIESDSSNDGPQLNGRPFGKPRQRASATNGVTSANTASHIPQSPLNPEHQRKPSKISLFQKWYKENPGQEPPLNGFPPDGPPLRSNQTKNDTNAEPSMYEYSIPLKSGAKRSATYSTTLPTVSEAISPCKKDKTPTSNPFIFAPAKYPNLFPIDTSVANPSGITGERESLTAFEGVQRSMIDQLLHNKRHISSPSATMSTRTPETHEVKQNQESNSAQAYSGNSFAKYRNSSKGGSPSKTPRSQHLHSSHSYDSSQARYFWTALEKLKASTNNFQRDRFSFNINDDTFKSSTTARPSAAGFSNSAENISTKFSEEDWTGKFEGSDYFKPVPKSNAPPSRAQSGSRSRGRSPAKPTVDPRYPQPRGSETEQVAESPGGTKFSAKEWQDTFKPQTFAPPPPRQVPTRKRTGPMVRPTMGGGAAVVDDGETSDEKPLFNGRKTPVTPPMPSPDAMDVDMPPPPTNTIPQFKPNTTLNVETNTSPKRAAAPSESPTDEATLKVNFDDLKIQDLLSTLEMPRPPLPPALPDNLPNTRPSAAAYEDYQIRFAKYMTAWDLYNNQFMLHLVARKNQNDTLGTKRWLTEEGLDIYRRGLKEDGMVLDRWAVEKVRHEGVVREWLVLKEQVKEAAREPARARKKTH